MPTTKDNYPMGSWGYEAYSLLEKLPTKALKKAWEKQILEIRNRMYAAIPIAYDTTVKDVYLKNKIFITDRRN